MASVYSHLDGMVYDGGEYREPGQQRNSHSLNLHHFNNPTSTQSYRLNEHFYRPFLSMLLLAIRMEFVHLTFVYFVILCLSLSLFYWAIKFGETFSNNLN